MNRQIDIEKLEELIQNALSQDFSGVNILRVNVVEDEEFEEDDVLRVEVVFQGKAKDVPARFMTRAIRKVRPVLSSFDVSSFPMMSFISEADAKIAARA